MGPYIPPPHAAAWSRVSHWVPVRPPIAAVTSPHSAMCHFSGLTHCWCV
ncbi:unnamed protein product [Staurois parvus]|uniref:Uncharacterized protein n=1 Tax=Staurois parvus TaxID=386267 RepID=A0ABN9AXY7_9NEOB|nr:unnamed protein product [Staurois parvus]